MLKMTIDNHFTFIIQVNEDEKKFIENSDIQIIKIHTHGVYSSVSFCLLEIAVPFNLCQLVLQKNCIKINFKIPKKRSYLIGNYGYGKSLLATDQSILAEMSYINLCKLIGQTP